MTYKGYVGEIHADPDCGYRGRVVNIKDTITFQGETVEEAKAAFRESVDEYLKFCAELGDEPEEPSCDSG